MKRIINIIVIAAAMLATASCVEPLDNTLPRQDLAIKFSCGVMTKADVTGDDNENLVKKIDYFIFPVNLDDDENMVGTTECVYHNKYVPSGISEDNTYTVVIEHTELAKMFPDGATSMMLFAVANYVDYSGEEVDIPTTMPDSDDPITWKALHELEVGPTFYKDGGPGYGLRWPLPMNPDDEGLFFVMTGQKEIELKAVSQEIPLERLASKVTVQFDYAEKCVDDRGTADDASDDITWIPQCTDNEIRAYLSNAVAHASLGGALDFSEENPNHRPLVGDSWDTFNNGTRDVFEFAYNYFNPASSTSTTPPTVAQVEEKEFHYYTYPISLDEGDDNQPYIKLVMRWFGYKHYVDASNLGTLFKQKEVYYKIVLPRDGIIDPNKIYEYKVAVDIVDNEKEVLVEGQYQVKDWISNSEMSANVAAGRYISLDIPKDEYDMYVNKFDINFVSSGTVIARVDSIYQLNYSSASGVTKDIFMLNDVVPNNSATNQLLNDKGVTRAQVAGWVTIPNETSYLEINHAMDNRILIDDEKNTAFDMAPYVFVVTLRLEEDTTGEFNRTVRITQYPAMFVTSRRSNGYAYVNGYSNSGSGNHICYDDRGTGSNDYRLGNFDNTPGSLNGSGDNSNPNNYIISTSILSGLDYVIGDPRSQAVDNLSNLGPRPGVVEKGLTNYHPTDPSGTEKMVAPKLLVASSYGVIGQNYYMNLEAARKRCAAYQENGYPAGRWRVPTAGEIIFMVTLSEYGFIPSLFNFYGGYGGGTNNQDLEGYWSANGKIIGERANSQAPFKPSLSLNPAHNAVTAVRCVYDAWYWGEEPYEENATSWLDFKD